MPRLLIATNNPGKAAESSIPADFSRRLTFPEPRTLQRRAGFSAG